MVKMSRLMICSSGKNMSDVLANITVKEISSPLSDAALARVIDIIKSENASSMLGKLPREKIKHYVQKTIQAKPMHLWLCYKEKDVIGYTIFADYPYALISEYRSFIGTVLMQSLKRLDILYLLNAALSTFKLDLCTTAHAKRKYINALPNLSYLAVHPNYQSQGIGKDFLETCIAQSGKQQLTVETNDPRTILFYQKQCHFMPYATRLRFLKPLTILVKKS